VDTIRQPLRIYAKTTREDLAAQPLAARTVIARSEPPVTHTTASAQFQTALFVQTTGNVTIIATILKSQQLRQ
jgi:hypothetical protein